MITPRYLSSVTQGRTCPVIGPTADISTRNITTRADPHATGLIAMSNQINSSSHLLSNNSSPTTDGAINRMSSAYYAYSIIVLQKNYAPESTN